MEDKKIELTVDEIQAMMDKMDKRTFGATTGMEWEGSIQNAPKRYSSEPEIPDCGCIYG